MNTNNLFIEGTHIMINGIIRFEGQNHLIKNGLDLENFT